MSPSVKRTLSAVASLWLAAATIGSCSTYQYGDDDDDGTGGTGGAGGSGGSATIPGGPEVLDVILSPPSITEGDVVTVTATVTDSDGLEDIIGGMLKSADGVLVYGPFVQLSGGTYSITLSWAQIHQIEAIEFETDTARTLRAEFTDATQKAGHKTASLVLTCNGYPACGGECADALDPDKCGSSGDCETVCTDLFNCGLEMDGGSQRCPGFHPDDLQSYLWGGDNEGCVAECEQVPALSALVDPNDCGTTIMTIKGANQDFACVCDLGVGAVCTP